MTPDPCSYAHDVSSMEITTTYNKCNIPILTVAFSFFSVYTNTPRLASIASVKIVINSECPRFS